MTRMSTDLAEVVNAMEGVIASIRRLAELGPALDDGGPVYFPNAIAVLSLIDERAGHLERLASQLATCVFPKPHAIEEGQP
jgi:hypothetical protein